MNNRTTLLLFLLFLIVSCTKSTSDYKTAGFPPVVISGYMARNDMGQDLGEIGNPDINCLYPQGAYGTANLGIFSFPNPSNSMMYVILTSKTTGVNARIWIVPAIMEGEGSEPNSFTGSAMIAPAARPLLDTTLFFSSQARELRLNKPPDGYYRIYLKSRGILLWDNIVFSNTIHY